MIRNVWAVGRNYADHAKELGNAVPEAGADPMIFLKAGSTVVESKEIRLLAREGEVHFEGELAFRFGDDLSLDGLTLALDLTARDLQTRAKKAGHPWALAKSFKGSCPIGPIVSIPAQDPQTLRFVIRVNGEVRQRGDAKNMIHSIEKIRRYVVDSFPVCPGDLLLTGTPEGVGALAVGDRVEAEIEGVVRAEWLVV